MINAAALEKDKGVQKLLKYHTNQLPLWTKARYGGHAKFVSATGDLAQILDPLKGSARRNQAYGRLLYFDHGLCSMQGRDGDFSVCRGRYADNDAVVVVPGLFQRWEQVDPVTYLFHIRRGALWSPVPPMTRENREITAEDIKWYLDIMRTESRLRESFVDVKATEVVDRYTVKVTMVAPVPDFLRSVVQTGMGLFPKECYEAGKACLGQKLVTAGPWILKEYVLRQKVLFEKNPEFFLKGLPYVDIWEWIVITDLAAQKAAFITGQVMNFRSYTEQEAVAAQREGPPGSILNLQYSAASGAGLRWKLEGPFADVRVRRALMLALDLRVLWQLGSDGLGVVPTEMGRDYYGFGKSFFFTIDMAGPWYQYDPKRAKELLGEAGYPNGFTTTINTSSTSGATYDYILGVQSLWKKNLNVVAEIKPLAGPAAVALLQEKKWDGLISSLTAGSWSDGNTGFATTVKGSPFNYQNIDDPVINELYTKARRELDPVKRAALMWQYEQREMDQVYVIRINHVWPFDVTSAAEMNGATHSWDFYYSLGVAGMTMLDPSKLRR